MEDNDWNIDKRVFDRAVKRSLEITEAIKATDYSEWLFLSTPNEGHLMNILEQVYCMMKYEGGEGL